MTETINEAQKTYWNTEGGQHWVAKQESMDRTLEPFSAILIDALDLQPHEKVIDIGCGCGATSLQLADRVPEGSVVGVDISGPMLARAAERQQEMALENVSFHESDAHLHDFDGHDADVLFSRFGVMFFDDPVGAFSNMRKGLKQTGRLGFACWQPVPLNAWVTVPMTAALPHLPPLPRMDPRAPGPFAFGDSDYVLEILDKSGFSDVSFEDRRAPMHFMSESLEDAAQEFAYTGPVGRMIAQLDDEGKKAAIIEDIAKALDPHFEDGTLKLEGVFHLVTAKNG